MKHEFWHESPGFAARGLSQLHETACRVMLR